MGISQEVLSAFLPKAAWERVPHGTNRRSAAALPIASTPRQQNGRMVVSQLGALLQTDADDAMGTGCCG